MDNNPLQNAANNMGLGKIWVGQNKNPQIAIPADEQKSGKWFCSALYRAGVITKRELLSLIRGHFIAIFTNGDFVYWYTKNAGKILEVAESQGFRWDDSGPLLMKRLKKIYGTRGFFPALQHYMQFCEMMSDSFADGDKIEPFRPAFYERKVLRRLKGTLGLFFTSLFWKQIPQFFKWNFTFTNPMRRAA